MKPKISPNLWFSNDAEEAAAFYVDLFPSSRVVRTIPYPEGSPGETGTTMVVEFELEGQRFVAINGGEQGFAFNESVSFEITCADQDEVDRYWAALTDGGQELQCGWCKDRFGVVWQVVPEGMDAVLYGGDPERAARAMTAMLGMVKLDIAALHAAAEGRPVG